MGCQNSKVMNDYDNDKVFKGSPNNLADKFSFMSASKNETEEMYLDDISYDGKDAIM